MVASAGFNVRNRVATCWSGDAFRSSFAGLARGAGISRPTFYLYFPSKDAVVLTLIDRLVEDAKGGREAAVRMRLDPGDSVAMGRLRKEVLNQLVEKQVLLAEANLPNVHTEATMLDAARRVVELAG